jgi:uncharacterized protein (DUF488 family)
MIDFFTIGVYGLTSEQFFQTLLSNSIDTFIDIRRRRAVRGSKYSFVNSTKLQTKLRELGIRYIHILDLAPTNEIRNIQKEKDKQTSVQKRERNQLSDAFIDAYKSKVLDKYDFSRLLSQLEEIATKKALFFCVEREPLACHRSLVTEKLQQQFSFPVIHLK